MSSESTSLSSDTHVERDHSFGFMVMARISDIGDGFKTFFVRIPSNELDPLSDVDLSIYTRHDHSSRADPSRFRSLDYSRVGPHHVRSARCLPISSAAVVGHKVYTLFHDTKDMCLKFKSLDTRTGVAYSHPPPSSPNRFFPKILSVCGKVYLLGGLVCPYSIGHQCLTSDLQDRASKPQPFGEVFNPQTKRWSALKRPPKATELSKRSDLFVMSLGDSRAKVVVFDNQASQPTFYIYDIITKIWLTFCPSPSFNHVFQPRFIVGNVVPNTYNDNIYWIDKRKGDIYALHFDAMQVYSGPIVGMEHVYFLKALKYSSHVTLHHLREEFFCLVWSEVVPGSSTSSVTTVFHFTFLRVVKSLNSNQLTAFVLGCFTESVERRYLFLDGISI